MEPGPPRDEATESSKLLFRTPSGPPLPDPQLVAPACPADVVMTCPDEDAQWVYVWECDATSPSRHSYDKLVVVGASGSWSDLQERVEDYVGCTSGRRGRPPVHPAFLDAVRDGWTVPMHTTPRSPPVARSATHHEPFLKGRFQTPPYRNRQGSAVCSDHHGIYRL